MILSVIRELKSNENLKSEDLIDGDHCEWNDYEQTERVISKYNHKITYNQAYFSLNTNSFCAIYSKVYF